MSDTLDQAKQTFVKNIESQTGKTIPQWIKIAKSGGAKHSEMVKYLKAEHGLSHGYANFIALQALAPTTPEADPVAAQYAGKKAALKPIYDALVKAINKFGKDVTLSPKKAYVSFRRNKQFASIQPTTATRVDVGLILKDVKPTARLEALGGANDMFTHRVGLTSVKDIDAELLKWLKQAYTSA
jgi:predicted transport protein